MSPRLLRLKALGLLLALGSCTDTYLYDQRREDQLPRDRTVALEGDFCTESAAAVVRPIKISIVMDASQSMTITDPDGSRAKAVVELLQSLPKEDEMYFSVLLFAGSTSGWLTASNKFEKVKDYDDTAMILLQQQILNFVVTNNGMPNRDATDFVKPLADVFGLISSDIADSRAGRTDVAEARARYVVLFLSDGQPTNNQDDELLCRDSVRRIRQLKDLADDVVVNTVHVFRPQMAIDSSACALDGGVLIPPRGSSCLLPVYPPAACPLLIINNNAERLRMMSQIGGGDFRDFRNNEPINFLSFKFGNVRRSYMFDKLVASNFSAPVGSPLELADTDSDGLLDFSADPTVADEVKAGTNPWVADTDGDGFSDGVEVHFGGIPSAGIPGRGAPFTPNQVGRPDGGGLDPGCPPEARGLDSDCDGLNDCDEQIIGTNGRRVDSDNDGIPDATEWKGVTQPASKDLEQDPDNDQLDNGDELQLHMNPLLADSSKLSATGYRYEVRKTGGIDSAGKQCFTFRIDNVTLANTAPDTRDAGNPDGGEPFFRRGAGYNDIFLSLSTKPTDDVSAKTRVRRFRHTTSRFPVGGIKSPVDGIIRVHESDFTDACESAVVTAP